MHAAQLPPTPGRVGHDVVLPGPVLGVLLEPGAAEDLVDLGLRAHKVRLKLRLLQDLLRQPLHASLFIVKLSAGSRLCWHADLITSGRLVDPAHR